MAAWNFAIGIGTVTETETGEFWTMVDSVGEGPVALAIDIPDPAKVGSGLPDGLTCLILENNIWKMSFLLNRLQPVPGLSF